MMNSNMKFIAKTYTIVVIGVAILILACMKYYNISVQKSIRKDELHMAYFNDGYNRGFGKAMEHLKIFKDSAIRSGVARYEIFDELTGEARFVWVTASNTVPVNPVKLNTSTE